MISYKGRSRRTVNFLKAMYFDRPEWTPCNVGILPAAWIEYREALEEVVLAHPRVFPGYEKGGKDFDEVWGPLYEEGLHRDSWGSVWRNARRGMDSIVVEEPLSEWETFAGWERPDAMKDDLFGPREEWGEVKRRFDEAKASGGLAEAGPLPHGFFFMRLYFLRGFENLMLDMASGEPRLRELIGVVETYNARLIAKCLELGAEYVAAGDDMGMQQALPVSPSMWREYVKPSYEAIFGQCRDKGVPVYLHSDGHILEIIGDLVDVGVRVVNPQIRANGLEGLVSEAKGRVAINLDLDRQMFPFATPGEIEEHIGEAYEALWGPEGGLMLLAEVGPDVPLANVDAICRSFEKLCGLPEPQAQ